MVYHGDTVCRTKFRGSVVRILGFDGPVAKQLFSDSLGSIDMKNRTITVHGADVTITTRHEQDYISLTDMVKRFGDENILYGWLRNRNTVEFLGIWEQIYNPAFKPIEFERFKSQAGLNSFALSPKKWIEATGAIGLYAKAGGTYAHKDIAFEFGSWLSPEFKLYLIKEFQRLKDEEARATSLEWNFQRTLAKVNYRIHTDAIKERLIPPQLTKAQTGVVYANEADLLNVALFGMTAVQWRQVNPDQPGNMRDAATLEQLVVLSNLESINAVLIHQGATSVGALGAVEQHRHYANTIVDRCEHHQAAWQGAGALNNVRAAVAFSGHQVLEAAGAAARIDLTWCHHRRRNVWRIAKRQTSCPATIWSKSCGTSCPPRSKPTTTSSP